MSAIALNDLDYYPQTMMKLECYVTHLHLRLMDLLLPWFHVQFYIRAPFDYDISRSLTQTHNATKTTSCFSI